MSASWHQSPLRYLELLEGKIARVSELLDTQEIRATIYFAYDAGNNVVEHLAGLDDHMMAVAAYWAAVAAMLSEKITLRQGARVMMKNWTE